MGLLAGGIAVNGRVTGTASKQVALFLPMCVAVVAPTAEQLVVGLARINQCLHLQGRNVVEYGRMAIVEAMARGRLPRLVPVIQAIDVCKQCHAVNAVSHAGTWHKEREARFDKVPIQRQAALTATPLVAVSTRFLEPCREASTRFIL